MQKVISELFEDKVKAIRAGGALGEVVTFNVYLWDDLEESNHRIFKGSTPEDIASIISVIERESEGVYKLKSIKPLVDNRERLSAVRIEESGRLLDVSNLYWPIEYRAKMHSSGEVGNTFVLRVNPREVYMLAENSKKSFPIKPRGVQFRLLQWFSEHAEFTDSKVISEEVGTTLRTMSGEIAKLRNKVSNVFGIDGRSFIESSQGEGYRPFKGVKIKIETGTS